MADLEYGSVEDFRKHLSALERTRDITEKQRALLLAHYAAPSHSTTYPELAKRAGLAHWRTVNRMYGDLAKRLAPLLGVHTAPTSSHFRGSWWSYILVNFASPSIGLDGKTRYVLRPPVVAALERLGWVETKRTSSPDEPDILADLENAKQDLEGVSETERRALVQARLGQGRFRSKLEDIWGGCALTGVQERAALRASHIKPWRDATNKERLDPHNGLLLVATLDALFDAGVVTFDSSGALMISSSLSDDETRKLGVDPKARLRKVSPRLVKYLEYHRSEVYRDGKAGRARRDGSRKAHRR